MQAIDLFLIALKNVTRAGVRSKLCVLAICVGITSVSSVLSFGMFAGEIVEAEMGRIGIGGVAVYHKTGESFTEQAVEVVADAPCVQASMPLVLASGTVQLRNLCSTAGILGIDEHLKDVFQLEVCHGSLPNGTQVRSAAKIAVIDTDFAQKVYQRTNVVGKTLYLTVNGWTEALEICAVIRSQSSGVSMMLGGQLPYFVYLPYTTLQAMDPGLYTDKMIANIADAGRNVPELMDRLERVAPQTYAFENLNQYMDSFSVITEAIALLIGGIAAISVVVGGLGVMNAMISSLDARTREIGIYRALGATKRAIVKTFLWESLLQCLAGGVAGVLCSAVLMRLIRLVFSISIAFQPESVLVSFGISIFCGIIFGILPALRAARLDPIRAIRTE
ncbi:MAG: ABC transporter permease [Clostridia bacterium]|nr:ABC transporter permease [Clostridia bacterium]